MTSTVSSEPAFFRGVWIEPGHPDYESARPVYNERVQPQPRVIARCAGVADVVSTIAFAREKRLRLDVRSTGKNLGGLGQGDGVIVDLSLMRGVQILPAERIARIQGGVRGGDLQTEAALHGLGAATGALSLTGVGLMLGGGIGHLFSRAGYASDNILSVELVTAAGEVVTASPERNPDLYWGVRGSTGNFGVVTALEVRLHDIPPVIQAGVMTWPLDNLEGPLRALREWDWASEYLNLIPEFSSAALDGRGGLEMYVCHTGPANQASVDIERLRAFGAAEEDTVTAMSFLELTFGYDDAFPTSSRTVVDEQAVTSLSDELIYALVAKSREPAGNGGRTIEVLARRGAPMRAPEQPSALRESAEDPTWMIVPAIWWNDESEDADHLRWTQEVVDLVRRIGPTASGQHPNTVGIQLDLDGARNMYADRFERLRALKTAWDPDNVFSGNHNLPPSR